MSTIALTATLFSRLKFRWPPLGFGPFPGNAAHQTFHTEGVFDQTVARYAGNLPGLGALPISTICLYTIRPSKPFLEDPPPQLFLRQGYSVLHNGDILP